MSTSELATYRDNKCFLQSEWVINIQVPCNAVDDFAKILGNEIPLIQGHYSHCMYIRDSGRCRFKGDEGVHGGAEETIQEVSSAEIIISIPQDREVLENILAVINRYHVHEEPTVRITDVFGLRSLYKTDVNNPHKYWNRSDSKEIHGSSVG